VTVTVSPSIANGVHRPAQLVARVMREPAADGHRSSARYGSGG
jgi:hypothetical protein